MQILDAHGRETAPVQGASDRFNDRALAIVDGFKKELAQIRTDAERFNSSGLRSLVNNVAYEANGPFGSYFGNTMNDPLTMSYSTGASLISMNRILLTEAYVHQGLLRTVVAQPVDDALRGGINFKSSQLDDEELTTLNREFKRKRSSFGVNSWAARQGSAIDTETSDLKAVTEATYWKRLFGGAGLIINTDQKFNRALREESIRQDSPLQFIAADRWELQSKTADLGSDFPFDYYGLPLHFSRVIRMKGDAAPAIVRRQLMGWGMSILEACIRPVNAFLKFENLLFELLDEAKIDVFGIQGYNVSLATEAGTALVQRRVQLNNQLKNYSTALAMDKEDTYDQKQLQFTGLADIWDRLCLNLCAYLKFPKNKLFGESSGGFSSGKDSMDNYNTTVEGVREGLDPVVVQAGGLRCQQLFGMIPDDLEAEYSPLSVLDGKEQEEVNTMKRTGILEIYDRGLYTGQEASEALRKNGLLDVESEVLSGDREPEVPMSVNPDEMEAGQEHDLNMQKQAAKNKPKPAAKKK